MSGELIKVGRYAPYPVWLGMTLLARGSQLIFLSFCVWAVVCAFDAMDKSSTTPFPPIWPWTIAAFLGCCSSHWRGKTSPVGDAIGNYLASQQCPACGQNVFDHSSGTAYAMTFRRQAYYPTRICKNCGHDLSMRTAS